MKVWREGGTKVRLKQSIEVENEIVHVATHSAYEGLLCYQVMCVDT